MKKFLVVATLFLSGVGAVRAADYYFPYFQVRQDQVLPPSPCGAHGGLLGPAGLGHDDGSMLALFTCQDQTVILWRDMRPGSGNKTAVGAHTDAIRSHLDAPSGAGKGFLTGGGWAFECGRRIVGIRVMVGDQVVYDLNGTNGTRPDVNAAYGASCPTEMTQSGFSFTMDTSSFSPGTYPVQFQAVDDQGFTSLSNTLSVTVLP